MKRPRRRKAGFAYPYGVLGSLKGDPEACLRYMRARDNRSRKSRRESAETARLVRALFAVSEAGKQLRELEEFVDRLRALNDTVGNLHGITGAR